MNADLRDKDYIDHILHAIGKINKYAGVSSSLKTQYNEVPWRQISGMRNRLIHGYMTTNLEIVWNTVEKVLPEFKKQIESIDLISD